MKGILLASHGRMAEGLLDTLHLFSGEIEQIETLCLLPEDDIDGYMEKMKAAIDQTDTGDGVVIFCDLLFGSPCNCASRLLGNEQYKDRVHVMTGMNLAMVLEFVMSRKDGLNSETLIDTGKLGIVDMNKKFAEMQK